ncbi:MAG: AAA family ATPase [Planctomycetota bacterium]
MSQDSSLDALRAALEVTPNNVPLRLHLADTLLNRGLTEDAEQLLKEGLKRAAGDSEDELELKFALVRCYRQLGKWSTAHVILDDLIQSDRSTARALVERARTQLREGQVEDAVTSYRRAIHEDPDVRDPELSETLGVGKTPLKQDPIDGLDDEEAEDPEVFDGRLRAQNDASSGPSLTPIKTDLNFESVGGMEDVKKDIRRKVVLPMKHPELVKEFGKKVGGGILLYGPPGCGKTHLARATAGEIDATFLEVGIHDVLDMWIGQSERNLHSIFETARANQPCVLFFDEADALGAARSDIRGAGRQQINQFLAELDGVSGQNDGVLVLGATNAPWQMDSAFRRPGRFDRVIFVPPPDQKARETILRILLTDKPQRDLDLAQIAKKCDGFSGADLKAVVDEAIEAVLDDALETGNVRPLVTKDLLKARKNRRPTTGEWFRTVKNHVLYANEDGLFDDVKPYLKL